MKKALIVTSQKINLKGLKLPQKRTLRLPEKRILTTNCDKRCVCNDNNKEKTTMKGKTTMEIKCTSCGFTSEGPDALSGKKLKCPKCGAEFIAGVQCEFTVVEESPISAQEGQNKKETIVEKMIGKIGALEVTNKRIRGSINKKTITANGMPSYERVSIDILHNLITGITVQVVENKGRLRCFICGSILILASLLLAAIEAPLLILLPIGIIVLVVGALCEDKVHLILSVAGVDYFIPYETSQTKEAEEKCKMLKDAKSEYEHIVGI